MTPPINSVSPERLDELAQWAASEEADCLHDDMPISAGYYADIIKLIAARRAANTPVDDAKYRSPREDAAYFGSIWSLSTNQMAELEKTFEYHRDHRPNFGADYSEDSATLSMNGAHFADPLADREKSAASPALPSQVVGVPRSQWGAEAWEILFGELKGAVPDELTDEVLQKLAETLIDQVAPCLTSPAAEPVGWETEAEWDLETRVFNAANNRDVPEWARKVVADVWKQYCLAANPAPSASREVTGETLLHALIALPHVITAGEVIFRADPSKPGNATAQIHAILDATLLAALPEREG